MRVLVTGGAGFIGFHLVRALAGAGHEVRVVDALLPFVHPDGAPPFSDDPGFEFAQADVRDRQAVDDALRGVDAVCHLAAMVGLGTDFDDAPLYAGCNGLGTAVLLAAMARAGVGRLVLASSMVVYGEGSYSCAEHGMAATPPPRLAADLDAGRFEPRCDRCAEPLSAELVREDAPVWPRNVYADTKVGQEHLAGSWARATGGRAVALRYHNVYGPGMPRDTPYAGVASFFRSALEAGRAPRVFEDGAQRRDFIHVRDVAGATVAGLEAVASDGPVRPGVLRAYNVGSGTPRTVGDMASALADAYGGPAPVVTGEYRLGDVRHVTASSERIARELGWQATVPFAEGVAEFAAAPAGRVPAGRVPAGRVPA